MSGREGPAEHEENDMIRPEITRDFIDDRVLQRRREARRARRVRLAKALKR